MIDSFFFDDTELRKDKPKPRKRKKVGCESCDLQYDCDSPQMRPAGDGKKNIVIIGTRPSEIDDQQDLPFADGAGNFLLDCLQEHLIDIERDCVCLNVLQCKTPENRAPTAYELNNCKERWRKQIKEAKPDLIFAFGTSAIQGVLSEAPFGPTATNMHGRVVPSAEWNCWVACGFHPSFYESDNYRHGNRMKEVIKAGLDKLEQGKYTDQTLDESNYDIIEDYKEVIDTLCLMETETRPVAFDYETTGLDPWAPKFKPLLISFACDTWKPFTIPLDHSHARWTKKELEGIYQAIREWLASDCKKIIQNWAYEELVSRVFFDTPVNNVIACTQVQEHVIDNREGVTNQKFQEFCKFGSSHKTKVNAARLDHEFLDVVAKYGALDSAYCLEIYKKQELEMDDDLRRAYALFHEATPQFVEMKIRGIKVDQQILKSLDDETRQKVRDMESTKQGKFAKKFARKYGKEWDPGSGQAKQRMFFDIMELEPSKLTKEGSNLSNIKHCSTDAESLKSLLEQVEEDSEEANTINSCLGLSSLVKLSGYISNFTKLSKQDGFLHPWFNLARARTYRSSSSEPNFQNIPVRIPAMAKLRTCLVPRFDGLMELDFAGAEVRGYATAANDKNLIKDIRNKIDFHRHFAAKLYELDEENITKQQRYNGKNGFVFPEFYGSYYGTIARNHPEWDEDVVKRTEDDLWERYKGVRTWQKEMQRQYERTGELKFLTGFRTRFGKVGLMSHNNVCNDPIQGMAFHRLVRVLLDIEYEMRRRNMKSLVVGQIHDSVVFDYVKDELNELIDLCVEIVRRPAWDFDTLVPWECEIKIGKNMLDWEEIEI